MFSFADDDFSSDRYPDALRIEISSADKILSQSFGEVLKPETINYRTFKPESDGLFCSKIFGPTKDYECKCGKYKRMIYRGIICDKCKVEVTRSFVRRERMGHISLAAPVAHIWFSKVSPSKIGTLIGSTNRELERVLYFESSIVIDPGFDKDLYMGQILSFKEHGDLKDKIGPDVKIGSGAEAIRDIIDGIDLKKLRQDLKDARSSTNSDLKKEKIVRRLSLVNSFVESGSNPADMIMTVLPVMPPELRPLVPLEGGKFATSDLNELYRRIINRNNRLKRLLDLHAPEIIIKNEKRMLQESVDSLFDNSRRGNRAIRNANGKRALKSLSDLLKGKSGRFRQNLLGKRVDYSGRSVITVNPDLALHECGLPYPIVQEVFKPFIINRMISMGECATVRNAKALIDQSSDKVRQHAEFVIRNHPILLNRAPTLHRLGIQAFNIRIVDGKSIHLHPLVCSAFNADFDGDQMAVHVPLSIDAQFEACILMLSTNNAINPSNGKYILSPTKDMLLGIYYATMDPKVICNVIFDDILSVYKSFHSGAADIHCGVKFRHNGNDYDTTIGRIVLYYEVSTSFEGGDQLEFDLFNRLMRGEEVNELLYYIGKLHFGKSRPIIMTNGALMKFGFAIATSSGLSFHADDLIVPKSKFDHISNAQCEIDNLDEQFDDGLVTLKEKYNKTIDTWSKCDLDITNDMKSEMSKDILDSNGSLYANPIYSMANSGARGSITQMKQLCGMRGLMTKPSGEIIESPITSNFKEGLTSVEYFVSTHGARKGLADTALKTANSGYLTRRLVECARDIVIEYHDCKTKKGITIRGEVYEEFGNLHSYIYGRILCSDVVKDGEIIQKAGSRVDDVLATVICKDPGIINFSIRSPVTCESERGICQMCYGDDLSTGKMVNKGVAVGTIAAQSIGEPGTQLTMRTFHIGGAASQSVSSGDSSIVADKDCKIEFINMNCGINSKGDMICVGFNSKVKLIAKNSRIVCKDIPHGAKMLCDSNTNNLCDSCSSGDIVASWDSYANVIVARKDGIIELSDCVDGISVDVRGGDGLNESTSVVIDSKSREARLCPSVIIDGDVHYLPFGGSVPKKGKSVKKGDVISRIPKMKKHNKDIVGGLDSVNRSFEGRDIGDIAIFSKASGVVSLDFSPKSRNIVTVTDSLSVAIDHFVPKGDYINAADGSYIEKGDIIKSGNISLSEMIGREDSKIEEFAHHMNCKIYRVYIDHGIHVNCKHIEVIVRKMLCNCVVTDPGDILFLPGDIVNRSYLKRLNDKTVKDGGHPALYRNILQGITKSGLDTESFLASAAFQDTTKILVDAAINRACDPINNVKETIMMGGLAPIGTGFYYDRAKKADNI